MFFSDKATTEVFLSTTGVARDKYHELKKKKSYFNELKDQYDDILVERDKVVRKIEALKKGGSGNTPSIVQLENTTGKLGNRMDAFRQLFRFLSYALNPVPADATPAEKRVLGTQLDPQRITLAELTAQSGALILKGEATDKGSIKQFAKRLRAAGYLTDVKLKSTTEHVDSATQSSYFKFLVSAKMAYPRTSRLDLQRGAK